MTGVVAFQFGEDSHRWDEREDTSEVKNEL